jgi:hypothetical protein
MSAEDERTKRIASRTAVFAKDVGVWDAEVVMHPVPGAAPLQMKGVSDNRRIGNGHWLVIDYKAESGFEGHGIYGWDEAKGSYVGVWVDSMQASIAQSQGTWNAETRTMTFLTELSHEGRTIRYREVTQTLEDGVQVYRNLLATPDGGELEMIKTTYRRRKV